MGSREEGRVGGFDKKRGKLLFHLSEFISFCLFLILFLGKLSEGGVGRGRGFDKKRGKSGTGGRTLITVTPDRATTSQTWKICNFYIYCQNEERKKHHLTQMI